MIIYHVDPSAKWNHRHRRTPKYGHPVKMSFVELVMYILDAIMLLAEFSLDPVSSGPIEKFYRFYYQMPCI